MSRETWADLQQNFLIGNCDFRPRAWHNDPALREKLGLEDNHYNGPIPYGEVVRRLFNWKPVAVPKANLIPCKKADANYFYEAIDGHGNKVVVPVKVSVTEGIEQGIVRSDTLAHIATHSATYQIHDYEQWLLKLQSNVIGDTLTILGAGLPRRGAQAYVQVALPETLKDDKTGIEIFPYVMASTSLDGSLPTTFSAQAIDVVCDNTRDMALRQAERAGRVYKAKHTSKSLEVGRIKDVREALGIIHKFAEDIVAEFQELAAISVNRTQVKKIWDIIIPIPDLKDATQRKITIAENKQEVLNHTYWKDPMMANQQGTALGVVQAVNTYVTHYATVRGAERFERNIENSIKGKFSEIDQMTVQAIATVCNKPELVSSK